MNRWNISNKYKVIMYIVALFLISRGLLYFTGFLGVNLFSNYETKPVYITVSQSPGWQRENMKLPESIEETQFPRIGSLSKFDSGFYLGIATKGYNKEIITEKHNAANWVFFPLFPLLLRIGATLTKIDIRTIAVIVSNISLLLSLIFLYLIGRQRGLLGDDSKKVLNLLLIYPASLFFSIPYTESIFLLLSCATIYFTNDRKYFVAFLLAGLSIVTRVPGFINLFYVIGFIMFTHKFQFKIKELKFCLYLIISLLPGFLFLCYMKSITGDFLAPFHEQTINWNRNTTTPFINLVNYVKHPYFIAPGGWDNGVISFVVSVSVLLVYVCYFSLNLKRMLHNKDQLLFFVYGFLLIAIPFSSSSIYLTSVTRYMMVSIPLYFFIVELSSRTSLVYKTYAALFMILNVIVTLGFFNNYYFVV